ncbi:SPOR domain-containing protein [Bacillus carboniphilus]|uniref:SPOR domain-containing protein n=1 Tax=Bacillus carboniphilus TaxID=86663 RepID=A0ABY9JXI0_9BACI|nr:SPOR domain-containing protein [Bacillus carboniphilus]WLR44089.1 SPOR domain-containing protein [Bacillus carboniphilus]
MKESKKDPIRISLNKKSNESSKEPIVVSSWEDKAKAEREIASAKHEEDFPWALPEEDTQKDPKVVSSKKKRKTYTKSTSSYSPYTRKPPSFSALKKLFVIVGAAIGLSVFFGILLMNFLSNESNSPQQVLKEPISGESLDSTNQPYTETSSQTSSIDLYMVQTGAFSSEQSAQEAVDQMIDKSIPAIYIKGDQYYSIYTSVYTTEQQAKEKVDLIKEKGVDDAFVDSIQLSVATEDEKQVINLLSLIITNLEKDEDAVNKKQLESSLSSIKNDENDYMKKIQMAGEMALESGLNSKEQSEVMQVLASMLKTN